MKDDGRDKAREEDPNTVLGLPISARREFVRRVGEKVWRGDEVWTEPVLATIRALARDQEWEVRQDVAELLVYLPDATFNELATPLLSDPTAYVKRAAEHSRQRRRVAHQEAKRASRGLDQFATHYELIMKKYGVEVALEAVRLGERRFELLSGALAHDLLGMLTAVRSHAQSIAEGVRKKDAELKASSVELDEGLILLERSLRDLLAYAQPVTVSRASERLSYVIDKATQMAKKSLKERNSDVAKVAVNVVAIPETTLDVSLHLIVSALCNLIKNACETFEGKDGRVRSGTVTVRAERIESFVRITIHNSGKGLSEEKLSALKSWLPAQRNRNKRHSTGYGVLNARKNIEEHGGSLDYESRVNEGVTAIVMLPL